MISRTLSPILKNRNISLLSIFLSALIIKLALFFFITDPIIFYKYPYFAEKISEGIDIGERILDISPLYLYVNVLFYRIYGQNWEVLTIFQLFLGSLNCLLIYLIGERIFDRTVGLIGATVLMLYGNLTLIEFTLEPETFVIFLNSLIILALIAAKDEANPRLGAWKWLAAGALIGLSIITKPNGLLFIPPAVLWIWVSSSSSRQKSKATLFLLMGIILLVSPITLRNYSKFHDFILITADGGKVFFHGNGPGATGIGRADLPHQGLAEEGQIEPDYAHVLFRKVARAQTGTALTPPECAHYWLSQTLGYMKAYPLQACVLLFKKFIFFWTNYEVHDIDSAYKNYKTLRFWPLLPFGVLSTLGIMGVFLAMKNFRQAFLLYSMVFVYLLSVLVFFAASRYRLPAGPFLAIFAAYALTFFYSAWSERRFKSFGAGIVVGFVLFSAINLPFRKEIGDFDRWQRATRIHYSLGGNFSFKKGLYQEAIVEFEKAISLEPGFALSYNRLGMSYANVKNFEAAERNFRKFVELIPGNDQGYVNLGLLYEHMGEAAKAIPFFEKALTLNPQNQKAKEFLQRLKEEGAPK